MLTAVVGVLLAGFPAGAGALEQPPAALGAAARHLHHQRHGEIALREAGAGQKPPEPAGLHHQIPPTDGADLLGDLVRHLDIDTLQILLRLFEVFLKIAVEIPEHGLPVHRALFHIVQLFLHVGSEFQVGDVAEALLHQLRDDPAQIGDVEVLALLHHILTVQNGGHRGGIGRRTADALLLHGPDQRGVGIVGRRLGEVLVPAKALEVQRLPFRQRRQGGFLFLLIIVLALLVHGGVAGEFQAGGAGAEAVSRSIDLHGDAVIHGVGHLAGHKATPHQSVQTVLLAGEVLFQHLRRPVHVAGSDGLVGVLSAGLGLIVIGSLGGIVLLTVAAHDKFLSGGNGLLADAERVGTHIGDQTHGALAFNIHALVKLLGDSHGAAGGHAELAAGLLLHGGGGKGGRGRTVLIRPFHGLDGKDSILRLLYHGFHLGGGFQFCLLAVLPVIPGGEGQLFHVIAGEVGVQRPVFLRLEILDLPLPIIHHSGGNRLDPSCGQAPLDLLPQQGTELIAHQPVQNTPGLLGIHQILVNVSGMLNALTHHVLRDLIEGDPLCFLVRQIQQAFQVPADGLALAVRVGCEVHGIRRLGGFFQVGNDGFLPLDGLVDRLEVIVYIHAEFAFLQVPEMAHAGLYLIVLAQIFSNGFGLRRRLHDDQALFCHSYLRRLCSKAAFSYSDRAQERVYSVRVTARV